MKILVTGGAGFIGYHLAYYLLQNTDHDVDVVDNLNDYYSVQLKKDRIAQLLTDFPKRCRFIELDIANYDSVAELFKNNRYDVVINLAAQAGVRYAKENPKVYVTANIDGFFSVIDAARQHGCKLVVYASSSSVYGANTKEPSSENDECKTPLSIYAASKLANEMIAESYKSSFGMRCIGMRFFNVYGAWGRPDAVYYKWADALCSNQPIDLRENGDMYRDFTYVGDVVNAIEKLISYGLSSEHGSEGLHEVVNIGNESPVRIGDLLEYLIKALERRPAKINNTKMGPEERKLSRASTDKLRSFIQYAPDTPYEAGMKEFVDWYVSYNDLR